MHMFNSECKLHKYESVCEIIDDFYGVRLATYKKRKEQQVKDMEHKLVKLSNRARYIQETLKGTIDLRRKTAMDVTALLEKMSFAKIDDDFKYLIKMPMDSVTTENVEVIMKEKTETETALDILKKTTLEQMWLKELELLETNYLVYKKQREMIQQGEGSNGEKKKLKITKKK